MSLSLLAAIAAAILFAVLVGHFVYKYFTTPGWSLTTAVNNSKHDLFVFFGVVGAAASVAFDHAVAFVGWMSGQTALAAQIVKWSSENIPAQAYGIATIIVLGLLAFYHKRDTNT